ncbi:MAG: type II toxin-antitoxin system RelE/ParE family toxin [Streptosporangiaceae bacterium]
MWTVIVLDQAAEEINKLPAGERTALVHAMEKLEVAGPRPHTSAVQGASGELRELRLRAGRSPWRGLYRRVGEVLVLAAIAPEAQRDPRGFRRAARRAAARLAQTTDEGG